MRIRGIGNYESWLCALLRKIQHVGRKTVDGWTGYKICHQIAILRANPKFIGYSIVPNCFPHQPFTLLEAPGGWAGHKLKSFEHVIIAINCPDLNEVVSAMASPLVWRPECHGRFILNNLTTVGIIKWTMAHPNLTGLVRHVYLCQPGNT